MPVIARLLCGAVDAAVATIAAKLVQDAFADGGDAGEPENENDDSA